MNCKNTRIQKSISALMAASFIFTAAVASSAQTNPPPPPRAPNEIILPANLSTTQPVGVARPALGQLETPFDSAAYRQAVKNGSNALQIEDWNNAAIELQEALRLNPQSREVAYNLGVAKFRQGDFVEAEKLFGKSAETDSADLAAQSMFNQGNAIYANVLNSLAQSQQNSQTAPLAAGQSQPPQPDLGKGIEQVEKAFTHFRDSLAANPNDVDSAVNAETAFQLLQLLKQEQEKQDQ